MNKRIFATIIGIAFCVTYLGGTIAMVGGLHQTTEAIASSFDQGPYLVFTDEDFANSVISGERLPGNNTTFVAFCFVNVTLRDNWGNQQDNVYAVSIFDPNDALGLNMTDESTSYQVLMGMQLDAILKRNSIATGGLVSYTLQNENNSVSVDNIA
ncbi:MAG: hypothetical protein KAX31_02645, partial [Thermoplasmata archaeon]|nr:hypothetical protein [Thermoplasmata archaeon]